MFSKKWIHYTKYKEEEMCGSSEEKRIYILFATLWKNVHSDVESSCSGTECGKKTFPKYSSVQGASALHCLHPKEEHYCNTERSLNFIFDGSLPFSQLPSGTNSSFIVILRTPAVDDRTAVTQYYKGNHFLNARHKCGTN